MAGSHSVLDELEADLAGPSRAGGSRPARRLTSGGEPAGAGSVLCPAIDQLNALMENRPDFAASRRLLQQVAAKAEARKKEEVSRAAARQAAEEEAAEDADAAQVVEEAQASMEHMRQQLNLGDLQQFRETEAVLQPLPPGDAEPGLDLDAGYLQAVAAAVAELGLEQEVALEDAEVAQEVFRCGLRSGFVRALALQRRAAGQPLVSALFATLAHSPNSETAGSAFVTLMALMGDGAPSGGAGGGADAGADAAAGVLMLDAHYGLPAAAATSGAAPQPPCRLDSLPTDAQLLEALKANGYSLKHGGGRQQSGAAQQQEQQRQDEEQAEGLVVRLQTIKLILRTAAAMCRYCREHPDSPAAAGALSREGVGELLAAALHMGLDPAANQLQEDVDAAAVELLGALEEADWQRKLPQLAERLVEMGPSHLARLKLLRKLPVSHPRGLALQQFAAALLLERLLPGKWGGGGGRSAINRRDASALDAAAVVAAQPWFSNPKGLVAGATSGGGQAPRGGYMIGALELVLKCCHLLIWPNMLTYLAEEPSCVTAGFLSDWNAFLAGVGSNIKCMQPEDQVVKVLAGCMQHDYTQAVEGLLPEHGAAVGHGA